MHEVSHTKTVSRYAWLARVAATLTFLLAGAPAGAQQLTACYVPASGTVYMINQPNLPTDCRSIEHVRFSWSMTGAQGVQGPPGEQGPKGDTGAQGPAGPLSGFEFHSGSSSMVPNGSANFGIFFATCSSATKSVVSFGYQANPGGTIFANRPAINGKQVLWAFQAAANTVWTFYWTCAEGVLP